MQFRFSIMPIDTRRRYATVAPPVPSRGMPIFGANSLVLWFATALLFIQCTRSSGVVRFVSESSLSPKAPYSDWISAATNIQDAINICDAGDVVLVTNGTYRAGAQADNVVALFKPIVLQSVNGAATTIIEGSAKARCAYLADDSIMFGFTLTNGSASTGGGAFCEPRASVLNCVLVGNSAQWGGGAFGGTLVNCTLSHNKAIWGGGTFMAALANSHVLTNTADYGSALAQCSAFSSTLVGNAAFRYGAAVDSKLVACVITGNTGDVVGGADSCSLINCSLSHNSSQVVGGASASTLVGCEIIANTGMTGGVGGCSLTNCLLKGNFGTAYGGGARESTLVNCTVVSNRAALYGGGIYYGTVANSIVYYNSADWLPNIYAVDINYSCSTWDFIWMSGVGNFSAEPRFADPANEDFHLLLDSPCINAGRNSYIALLTDLDGKTRSVAKTTDVGAYEVQNPASTLSYAWAQRYALPTDGSADHIDTDSDGADNWSESRAQTDPTNTLSVLRLLSCSTTGADSTVSWQSVAGLTYCLEANTNLATAGSFYLLSSNISGKATSTFFTHTNPSAIATFYRVGVAE